MTDAELIARLRLPWPKDGSGGEVTLPLWVLILTDEAADRIEALTDKLEAARAERAKAVEALDEAVGYYDKVNPFRQADYHNEGCDCDRCRFDRARATIAEIKGESHDPTT